MAAAIAVFSSCNKDPYANSGLINVTLSSDSKNSKTEVTPGGLTRWSIGDEVQLVDADLSLRTFKYAALTPQATAKFEGQLLGNRGKRKYYAFYAPKYTPCYRTSGYNLTIERYDLDITEDSMTNPELFGQYCPMIGIPTVFDAADPKDSKRFQFYHVNCLIEASIASIKGDDRLHNMIFDKAIFEMRAADNSKPFNTKIKVNMDDIVGPPEADLPYTSIGEMTDVMSSSFTLNEPHKFGNLLEESDISTFGIPIFALPTQIDFEYELDVLFYLNDEIVCRLRKRGRTDGGLKAAGLNVCDFNENQIIP